MTLIKQNKGVLKLSPPAIGKQNFPVWVPADLIELRKQADISPENSYQKANALKSRGHVSHENLLKILDSLISYTNMEAVWKAIFSRKEKFKFLTRNRANKHLYTSQSLHLFDDCVWCYRSWQVSPKMTKKEASFLYRKISAKARELSNLINAGRYAPFLQIPSLIENKREVFQKLADQLCIDKERLPEWARENISGFIEVNLRKALPELPDLLLAFEGFARREIDRPLFVVAQPRNKQAHIHMFVRELSESFARNYGQPLHKQVAVITSAIFDYEMNEDSVRLIARENKQKRSSRPNTQK